MSQNTKLVCGSILAGACAVLLVAIVAQAQYNVYDSDSNSAHARRHNQQFAAAATKNLYNRQQPLQYAPTQHRRNYGSTDGLSGYSPVMGASNGRGSRDNSDNDDDEGSNSFGPTFGANFDGNENEGEGSAANGDGQAMNLDKAASGYPGQADYSGEGAGAGFGFGASGYGPSSEGSDFGPSEASFGGDGRRAKSASSLMGSRGNFGSEEDAGAPQYGPNSAINGGEADDEGRAGYSPEGSNDNDADDE